MSGSARNCTKRVRTLKYRPVARHSTTRYGLQTTASTALTIDSTFIAGPPSEEHAQGDLGTDDAAGIAAGNGEFDAGDQPQRRAEVVLDSGREGQVATGRAVFVDGPDATCSVGRETGQALAGLAAGGNFHHADPAFVEAVFGAHGKTQYRAPRDMALEAVLGAVHA